MTDKVKLTPIAMVRPSEDFVQAPSALRPEVEMSQVEFENIADTARAVLVSLEDDGISNPQQITTYTAQVQVQGGKGWVGRFIRL